MESIAKEFNIPPEAFSCFVFQGQEIIEFFDTSFYGNYELMIRLIENKIKLDVELDPGTPMLFEWFPSGFAEFADKWLSNFDYDCTQKVDDLLLLFEQNSFLISYQKVPTEKDLVELCNFAKILVEFVGILGDKYTTPLTWWEHMFIDNLIEYKAIDALKEINKGKVYCLGKRDLEIAKYFFEKGDKDMMSVIEFLTQLQRGSTPN